MAKKQQTKKRRVAAARQVERQQAAAAKAERRKRLIVGGVVGFLALALIAPLTAGLIVDNDPEPPPVTTTVPFELPWAAGTKAGATLTGPTPCPATDGSEIRTTEFGEAPPLCVEPGATYDLMFETSVGSFSVPVDASRSEEAANLAAVLAWYRAYEQTPVISLAGGLLWIGSPGDAGFTVEASLPDVPVAERYPIGTVAAIPADGNGVGINGALMVVLDEPGSLLMQSDPRYVPVGTIDDLTALQAVYDSPESDTTLEVESVTVTKAG